MSTLKNVNPTNLVPKVNKPKTKGMPIWAKLIIFSLVAGLVIGGGWFLYYYLSSSDFRKGANPTGSRHPHESKIADPKYWTTQNNPKTGKKYTDDEATEKASLYACCKHPSELMPTPVGPAKTWENGREPIQLRYQGKCCCDPNPTWYDLKINPQNTMTPARTVLVASNLACPKPETQTTNSGGGSTGECETKNRTKMSPSPSIGPNPEFLGTTKPTGAPFNGKTAYIFHVDPKPYPMPSTCQELAKIDVGKGDSIKWTNPSKKGYPFLATYVERNPTRTTLAPDTGVAGAIAIVKPQFMGGYCNDRWPWVDPSKREAYCVKYDKR